MRSQKNLGANAEKVGALHLLYFYYNSEYYLNDITGLTSTN